MFNVESNKTCEVIRFNCSQTQTLVSYGYFPVKVSVISSVLCERNVLNNPIGLNPVTR